MSPMHVRILRESAMTFPEDVGKPETDGKATRRGTPSGGWHRAHSMKQPPNASCAAPRAMRDARGAAPQVYEGQVTRGFHSANIPLGFQLQTHTCRS